MMTPEQHSAVERALDAAVSSAHLAGSRQLRDFLTYIVTKVLRGESEDIKAYSIAVDALGRDESFDPQNSATVRVAAGRLRQALALHNAQYAADEVSGDNRPPVEAIIHLEPGSYIPTFEFIDLTVQPAPIVSEDDPPAQLPDEPSLPEPSAAPVTAASPPGGMVKPVVPWVVLPIIGALIALMSLFTWMSVLPKPPQVASTPETEVTEPAPPPADLLDASARPRVKSTLITPSDSYPDWFKPQEAKDAIILTAVRFDDYEFIGGDLVNRYADSNAGDADFHLQVTLYAAGDDVRGYAQLSRAETGSIVWSRLEVFKKPENPPIRDMADLAGRRVAPLLSPYAVVQSDMVRSAPDRAGVACLLKSYRYFNNQSDARHRAARDCAEELVERGSRLPSVHAVLTFLYLDEYRENRNRRERDPLAAADRSSRLAVEFGPESARAYQARLAVHKVLGDTEAARSAGEKALSLNPYDTDIIADFAAWLISQGEAERGYRMLRDAEDLFDARPAWVEVFRFLSAWMTGKYEEANSVARFLDPARSPMVAAIALMDAALAEDGERAFEAAEQLKRGDSDFLEDPKANLARRGFAIAVAEKMSALIGDGKALAEQFKDTSSPN